MWRSAGACIRIKPSGLFWHRRVLVETTNEGTGGNYHAFLYAIVRENRRAPQQNSGGQRVIMVTNRITLMLLMIELIWLPVKSAHCWAKLSLIKEENWHKRGGSCR
ncbi:hypothetical protein niasHT_016499 [Heterodera trifolii]|uniref:Uncharacterized protein n=1 Tax=Heterodera trifolii TaxID=157864 RepID=A0ABD2LF37_9BILA